MNNDSELLQRSAQKDRAAFKSLYEQTSPKLFALALHIMQRESLAEEVLQEAYLKIWNHADSYDLTKGSVIGWMSVVTRNTAFDALQALSRRPVEVETSYEGPSFICRDNNLNTDKRVEHDDQLQWIVERLQRLRPEQRQCILFSHYYGYTHQELSKMLGKPLGTIKTWIRRGSQQLLRV